MSDESRVVLHIPIQINGGDSAPEEQQLLERELFVLDNGTMYVGKKDGTAEVIIGRIAEGSELKNMTLIDPTVKGNFTMNEGKLILPGAILTSLPEQGEPGQIVFVDANPS